MQDEPEAPRSPDKNAQAQNAAKTAGQGPEAQAQGPANQGQGNFERDKLFLEKLDQIIAQYLYIAAGTIALLAVLPGILRAPYSVAELIWAVAVAGLVAIVLSALLRLFTNAFFRRLARGKPPAVERSFWTLLTVCTLALAVEVTAFAVFVGSNLSARLQEGPRILSVTASPATTEPGGLITVEVEAEDRDNDRLTYIWTAADGDILDPDEPKVTWIAPSEIQPPEQRFAISVEVSDGRVTETEEAIVLVRAPVPVTDRVGSICRSLVRIQSEPPADPAALCKPATEFIESGLTDANRQLRADFLQSQIELAVQNNYQIQVPPTDPDDGKVCCSEALIPLRPFCNPGC
jgi:hypothetical protein